MLLKAARQAAGRAKAEVSGGERVDTKQADERFYAGMTNEALEDKIATETSCFGGWRAGGKRAAPGLIRGSLKQRRNLQWQQ